MLEAFLTVLTIALTIGLAYTLKQNRDLGRRLTNLESRAFKLELTSDKLAAEQDTLARDWSQLFGNVQASWSEHLEQVSKDVVTQFALQKHTRPTVRR